MARRHHGTVHGDGDAARSFDATGAQQLGDRGDAERLRAAVDADLREQVQALLADDQIAGERMQSAIRAELAALAFPLAGKTVFEPCPV